MTRETDLPFEIRKTLAVLRAEKARYLHGLAQNEADRMGVLETLDKIDKKDVSLRELLVKTEQDLGTLLTEHGLKPGGA